LSDQYPYLGSHQAPQTDGYQPDRYRPGYRILFLTTFLHHLQEAHRLYAEPVSKGQYRLNMSKQDCILTIDLGTGAVRIFAFDLQGIFIGSMKGSYPTFHREPDQSEQDPEQIFITVLYVLKNLLNERIQPSGYRVSAICFSAAMHSVLPVDK